MSKVGNLGRVTIRAATVTFFNNTEHEEFIPGYEDCNTLEFEIATTFRESKVRDNLLYLNNNCDYLHSIRTEPPLPLAFFVDNDRVLDSVWDDRGLEFVDPLPLTALHYCRLLYAVLATFGPSEDITIIQKLSYVRDTQDTSVADIELTNGRVFRVENGRMVQIDSNDPYVKSATS